ncbi:helicase-associated domain-containing protein [Microlunatus soli]|uniref:Helicase conserved C-terminal domain-containing protein n=1 Tax=Microlunatus soli TaxID=630515 RepID=A0A1H1RLD3_9ACTN|nr:helicase-associated domain-containing protein [Microlunatus soli]SDS36607.1 Helicase conserved C-terminal domain-containing protein [Microlunatus soli]
MTARTLSESLRTLDQDQLAELLRLRPDLRYPLPRHIAELVSQATTSTSVNRAIDRLNGWQLAVVETLAVLDDGSTVEQIADLLDSAPEQIAPAVDLLRRQALLWGDDRELHLVRAVRDHFGNYPAGLAPRSPQPLSDEQIDQALAACGDQVRPVLDRLLWGPPTGTVRNADRTITVSAARSPIEQLLARRLLRPLDRDTVILSREVALRLRSQQSDWLLPGEPVAPQPPELTGPTRSPAVVRSAAAGAAHELVHDAELIIADLDSTPRRLLRDGGLSTRDVQALSRTVDGRVDYTGFLLELAAAAGLIGTADRITLLPTVDYDLWVTEPGPDRWQRLATAWRDTERQLSTEPGSHPLATDAIAARAPENRRLLLGLAARAQIGTVLDAGRLADGVGWHRPAAARNGQQLRQLIEQTWQQAGWLGLVALGAVSDLLPVIACERDLPDDLRRLFPEPLDHVIVQSDLTAIAQGPLEAGVAGTLRLVADQESRGGGAVYRFSQSSVRRAFDAGWAALEIGEWLERHSSTGIPQPLRYLIDDVARQHGTVRVGAASSYLRIEDPAQQAAILAHPSAARLQLRQIAPGVVVSPADPDEVVTALQDIGLKPAAEDNEGRLLTTRPRRRAPVRHDAPGRPAAATPDEAAAAILAAEQRLPPPPTSDGLDILAEAAGTEDVVEVTIVSADGTPARRTLRPITVGDGIVRAIDAESNEIVSIPVSRISAARSEPRTI